MTLRTDYGQPVAELRRALIALRLEVPSEVADDITKKAEAVIAVAMKVPIPQSDDD